MLGLQAESIPVLLSVLSKVFRILEDGDVDETKLVGCGYSELVAQHVDKMINWLKSCLSLWPYGKPIVRRDELIQHMVHWRMCIVRMAVDHYLKPLCHLLKKNAKEERQKKYAITCEEVFCSR